jgi:hypothetical protein
MPFLMLIFSNCDTTVLFIMLKFEYARNGRMVKEFSCDFFEEFSCDFFEMVIGSGDQFLNFRV